MNYSWPPGPSFWAEEFPAQTNDRTSPFLFKNIIPVSAATDEAVLDGFAAIRQAKADGVTISAHARVYVGEDRRDDLLPAVLDAPGWNSADFVSWMQQQVGAERFSLVINNLETVSPSLAAGLGSFVGSLIEGWGVPMGAAEQVAFVGNYSGTAFGVHEGYEDAFLTHFGPGTKHFYTWSADDYRKLTGGDAPLYGDYSWLLEHGQRWVLEPGDALFLPRRVFHVGRQDEFSVSVAIPVYTYSDAAILRQVVLPELFEKLLSTDPDSEQGQPSPMANLPGGPSPVAQRLLALANTTLNQASAGIAAAIDQHMNSRWNTVLSNGGWEMVDHDLARGQAVAAFDPAVVVAGAHVSVTAPYRLLLSGDEAFLRGCVVAIDPAVFSDDFVASVNSGPVAMSENEPLIAALRRLGTTGGLTITPRPAQEAAA